MRMILRERIQTGPMLMPPELLPLFHPPPLEVEYALQAQAPCLTPTAASLTIILILAARR